MLPAVNELEHSEAKDLGSESKRHAEFATNDDASVDDDTTTTATTTVPVATTTQEETASTAKNSPAAAAEESNNKVSPPKTNNGEEEPWPAVKVDAAAQASFTQVVNGNHITKEEEEKKGNAVPAATTTTTITPKLGIIHEEIMVDQSKFENLPSSIRDKIWSENMDFLRDKNVYDFDYLTFLWNLCQTSRNLFFFFLN